MAKEIFNRYENKFMLDKSQYEKVREVLEKQMILDAYNKNDEYYTITNVYYDTINNDFIRHSLSKPIYKEKVRLRAYGVPNKEDFVFVEVKKKFDGLVNKRRTKMKLYEAEYFLNTGIAPPIKDYMNSQVIDEISYFLSKNKIMPKTYIAYDRVAFFGKDDLDFRVTFDMNVRSRRKDLSVSCGSYGVNMLDDDVYLMEVKSSTAIPLWFAHIIAEQKIVPTSFSKYGKEYKNMLAENDKKIIPIEFSDEQLILI